MYDRFGLILMVTHQCNLRCGYCYIGAKSAHTMSRDIGQCAIDRAVKSLSTGGTLELGFFGGEPLLEAGLLSDLLAYACTAAVESGICVRPHLTTNGTMDGDTAWRLLLDPGLNLGISCDGLPEIHDRHRRTADGQPTSARVISTIRRLVGAGRAFHVAMVVRPDTAEALPDGMRYLCDLGVRRIAPTLDLWARWSEADAQRLERAIARCAEAWADSLPHLSVGWFDEKAGLLARVLRFPTARCGFGDGELAVAPSGRLYPCERLIGEDADDNPMRLAGHILDGTDFLPGVLLPPRQDEGCTACAMEPMCNTFCRCSNYVRSGDIRRPDLLLCRWNQACLLETARVLKERNAFVPAGGRRVE